MKIFIASNSSDLNGKVAERFARAPFFILYDTVTHEWKAIENTDFMEHGMGPKIARLASDNNVDLIYSASPGPNALQTLNAFGIKHENASGESLMEILKKEGYENT